MFCGFYEVVMYFVKKNGLSDCFESQKKVARAVANGLLSKEIIPTRTSKASSSDLRKAQMRGHLFAVKHGL